MLNKKENEQTLRILLGIYPLLIETLFTVPDRHHLIGITSFGIGCNHGDFPGMSMKEERVEMEERKER